MTAADIYTNGFPRFGPLDGVTSFIYYDISLVGTARIVWDYPTVLEGAVTSQLGMAMTAASIFLLAISS